MHAPAVHVVRSVLVGAMVGRPDTAPSRASASADSYLFQTGRHTRSRLQGVRSPRATAGAREEEGKEEKEETSRHSTGCGGAASSGWAKEAKYQVVVAVLVTEEGEGGARCLAASASPIRAIRPAPGNELSVASTDEPASQNNLLPGTRAMLAPLQDKGAN